MKKHILQTVLEETGHEVSSYREHSMARTRCIKTYADGGVGGVVADILSATVDMARQDEDFDPNPIEKALRGMRTDSLGLNRIVYFPSVEFVEGDDEDEGPEAALNENGLAEIELPLPNMPIYQVYHKRRSDLSGGERKVSVGVPRKRLADAVLDLVRYASTTYPTGTLTVEEGSADRFVVTPTEAGNRWALKTYAGVTKAALKRFQGTCVEPVGTK